MEDLKTAVVFPPFTEVVIYEVRPVPRHPLASGDDVTHSAPVRTRGLRFGSNGVSNSVYIECSIYFL